MRFKIDENLPIESAEILQQAGYESDTVHSEKITGADDRTISQICKREGQILLTLDLGFSDIRTYPPSDFPGILILRLARQDKIHVMEIIQKVITAMGKQEIAGKLWIVEENRIRIRG